MVVIWLLFLVTVFMHLYLLFGLSIFKEIQVKVQQKANEKKSC